MNSRNLHKLTTALIAFAILSLAQTLSAVTSTNSGTQTGKQATVSLLATQRISGNGAPDGIRFLFLVKKKPEVTGQFTLKETSDFIIEGRSYRKITKTELGREFEPHIVVSSAEGFFEDQPGARHLAPNDIKDSHILTVAIGGTNITKEAKGKITLQVGFDKQVEPFEFEFITP